jgi:hypothetical protein
MYHKGHINSPYFFAISIITLTTVGVQCLFVLRLIQNT